MVEQPYKNRPILKSMESITRKAPCEVEQTCYAVIALKTVSVYLDGLKLCWGIGVADGARTHDNWNHNPGLYQLSYSHH